MNLMVYFYDATIFYSKQSNQPSVQCSDSAVTFAVNGSLEITPKKPSTGSPNSAVKLPVRVTMQVTKLDFSGTGLHVPKFTIEAISRNDKKTLDQFLFGSKSGTKESRLIRTWSSDSKMYISNSMIQFSAGLPPR